MVKNESEIINTEDDRTYIASVLPKNKLMNAMLAWTTSKREKIYYDDWVGHTISATRYCWLTKTDSTGKMFFDVIGNAGIWKIKKIHGVSRPSGINGSIPQVTFQKNNSGINDINIKMEYKGTAIISPVGKKYKGGAPYNFFYKEFGLPIKWKTNWYAFDSTSNPLEQPAAFHLLLNTTPLKPLKQKH